MRIFLCVTSSRWNFSGHSNRHKIGVDVVVAANTSSLAAISSNLCDTDGAFDSSCSLLKSAIVLVVVQNVGGESIQSMSRTNGNATNGSQPGFGGKISARLGMSSGFKAIQ